MVAEGKRDPKVGSSVAADVMTRAVESKDTIKINLVNNDPYVDFDSYFKERVDVGDLDSVAQGSPELRAAIVVHVIEENIQANTIKREQPGLDPMARFNLAHDRASSTEATMFGAVSRQEFTGKNSI